MEIETFKKNNLYGIKIDDKTFLEATQDKSFIKIFYKAGFVFGNKLYAIEGSEIKLLFEDKNSQFLNVDFNSVINGNYNRLHKKHFVIQDSSPEIKYFLWENGGYNLKLNTWGTPLRLFSENTWDDYFILQYDGEYIFLWSVRNKEVWELLFKYKTEKPFIRYNDSYDIKLTEHNNIIISLIIKENNSIKLFNLLTKSFILENFEIKKLKHRIDYNNDKNYYFITLSDNKSIYYNINSDKILLQPDYYKNFDNIVIYKIENEYSHTIYNLDGEEILKDYKKKIVHEKFSYEWGGYIVGNTFIFDFDNNEIFNLYHIEKEKIKFDDLKLIKEWKVITKKELIMFNYNGKKNYYTGKEFIKIDIDADIEKAIVYDIFFVDKKKNVFINPLKKKEKTGGVSPDESFEALKLYFFPFDVIIFLFQNLDWEEINKNNDNLKYNAKNKGLSVKQYFYKRVLEAQFLTNEEKIKIKKIIGTKDLGYEVELDYKIIAKKINLYNLKDIFEKLPEIFTKETGFLDDMDIFNLWK